MKTNTTTALALLCALLLGALARDLLVPIAHADGGGLTTQLAERLVRATESQAKATEELARNVRDAGRECGRDK